MMRLTVAQITDMRAKSRPTIWVTIFTYLNHTRVMAKLLLDDSNCAVIFNLAVPLTPFTRP